MQHFVQLSVEEVNGVVNSLWARRKILPGMLSHLVAFWYRYSSIHYDDVRMGEIASQITSLSIVYSIVYSDADQRKHQSSAALAFVRGIHRGPVNSPHKWPVTRKMFPFDDVIMFWLIFSGETAWKVNFVDPARLTLIFTTLGWLSCLWTASSTLIIA